MTAMKTRSTSPGAHGAGRAPTAGVEPRAGGAAGATGWAGGGTETESAAALERGVSLHARTATLCPPTSPHAQPRSPSSSPARMKVNMAASTLPTGVAQSLFLTNYNTVVSKQFHNTKGSFSPRMVTITIILASTPTDDNIMVIINYYIAWRFKCSSSLKLGGFWCFRRSSAGKSCSGNDAIYNQLITFLE